MNSKVTFNSEWHLIKNNEFGSTLQKRQFMKYRQIEDKILDENKATEIKEMNLIKQLQHHRQNIRMSFINLGSEHYEN